MRLKYIEDTENLANNKKYLMVGTSYWQNTVNPEDGDLDIINNEPKAENGSRRQAGMKSIESLSFPPVCKSSDKICRLLLLQHTVDM